MESSIHGANCCAMVVQIPFVRGNTSGNKWTLHYLFTLGSQCSVKLTYLSWLWKRFTAEINNFSLLAHLFVGSLVTVSMLEWSREVFFLHFPLLAQTIAMVAVRTELYKLLIMVPRQNIPRRFVSTRLNWSPIIGRVNTSIGKVLARRWSRD